MEKHNTEMGEIRKEKGMWMKFVIFYIQKLQVFGGDQKIVGFP